jgi:N-acetyl-alpha-D-glucosaminyl L-malate synthase BshA
MNWKKGNMLAERRQIMKIGVMCHSSCGGSARIALDMAAELALRRHRVHLFTRTTPFFPLKNDPSLIQHTVCSVPSHGHCASHLKTNWPRYESDSMTNLVLDVVSSGGLDVLHIHYALPFAFIAATTKNLLGKAAPKCIATLHGTDVSVHGRNPVKGPRLIQALRNFEALTTVSNSHACLAVRVFNLDRQPVVIPNFIEPNRFEPKQPRLNGRRPRILHVSNFRPIKDPVGVVRIFAAIRRQIDAELWLAGDGEKMIEVRGILDKRELSKDVRYLGLRNDVRSFLQETDLLLITSHTESFCLAALEAMACGVPVLGTKVGGLPDVVVHGRTGFLFPFGEHSVAANLAVDLLSNPHLYQSLSTTAREHARRFDQKATVTLYENLYHQVLNS